MSISPHPYRHVSLSSGHVFRYLILEPGIGDEPLKCSIQTALIGEIEFDALSYVWGSSTKDHEIFCHSHVMKITANLSNALRCLRHPDTPLRIWADSICINQGNSAEKSHQVSLMGRIYRAARHVLLYMGPDGANEGPALCSLIRQVNEMIQEKIVNVDLTWDSFPYPEDDDPLLAEPGWDSLHTLLGQTWFDRGWVVQEAAVANHAIVIWGDSKIDWNDLMRTYVWLYTRAEGLCHDKNFTAVPINAHFNIWIDNNPKFTKCFFEEQSWGAISVLRTLTQAKELDLQDPRDRIYAFCGLPQNPITIYPDYRRTHLEAYREFAQAYIELTKSVEVLDFVSHNERSITELDSWVPRWDISSWSLCGGVTFPSVLKSRSGSTGTSPIIENGNLKVQGVVLGTIFYASDVFDWETTTPKIIQAIWNSVEELPIIYSYLTGYDSGSLCLNAFLDALSGGACIGTRLQWRQARKSFAHEAGLGRVCEENISELHDNSPTAGMSVSVVETTSPSAADGVNEDTTTGAINDAETACESNIYFSKIKGKTDNKKLIVTDSGYIGLAPSIAQVGDSYGIIFGCKLPCVLRRASREMTFYYIGSTNLVGTQLWEAEDGGISFESILGDENSKDWLDWDVEEQDIYLC